MLTKLPNAGEDSPPSERQQYNELLVLGYMTDYHINVRTVQPLLA